VCCASRFEFQNVARVGRLFCCKLSRNRDRKKLFRFSSRCPPPSPIDALDARLNKAIERSRDGEVRTKTCRATARFSLSLSLSVFFFLFSCCLIVSIRQLHRGIRFQIISSILTHTRARARARSFLAIVEWNPRAFRFNAIGAAAIRRQRDLG